MSRPHINLVSLIEKELDHSQETLEEIGTVIDVGDGIGRIHGLENALFGELISFEGGNKGVILDMKKDYVSVVLLDRNIPVVEQEIAKRTGKLFSIPVGNDLLGRIIDATGKPLDGLGEVKNTEMRPIEKTAPDLTKRTPVHQSFETGITLIDALIPIGKGQRELIIGNRSTGKTTIALDIILHQKGKDVVCVYVGIGHKQSNTAKIIDLFEKNGASSYSIIVDANAQESALHQFIAPYAGCTIAEYFLEQGRDVLIIYDDLSNHAIAYRELSLLLRRPPGREAYPGDIFYIHSRLLERACKLSDAYGGGSLTALPIAQTQGNDISAYIPTNLISITDGQIFLSTDLFNNGIRPAINVGLSVSRVGGAAQTKAMKKMSGTLKLDLAQYDELLTFAQFGSELDKTSQQALDYGKRAIELLKQKQHETYSFVDQSIFLYLLSRKYLNQVPLDKIKHFVRHITFFIQENYPEMYQQILQTHDISSENLTKLKSAAEEFILAYAKTKT